MATILYVDDDIDLSRAIGKTLSRLDYSVQVINSAPDAWEVLKSNRYDLIILDWEMPGLNGIDILKLLRSAGDTTPVIMLTGRAAVSDKLVGLNTGANDYLTKPFETEELIARMRAVLRTKTEAISPPKPLGENNKDILDKANLAGTTLASRFEFIDVIGEGGAAIVFKARHPQLDKFVAIKMLNAEVQLVDKEAQARFENEARIVSKLDHSNIITVYDFGITEHKQPYMVMELIDGPSLHLVLKQRDYLPLAQALPILLSICDGLAYAHEQGVLHRDIKPGNIVLKQAANQQQIPKILDFGLAKLLQLNAQKAANLTQAQQIVGSPPYMSPEQVHGGKVDHRSDIYSLGCMVFEVVTGYAPFTGDSPGEIALKRLEEPPLTFAETRPEVKFPPELERLISQALAKDPTKRYQSMRDLQEDLRRILSRLENNSILSRLGALLRKATTKIS